MAKQETGTLFEETSRGAVGAVTALAFVLSFALVVGGIVLLSYADYSVGIDAAGGNLPIFAGGLGAVVIGFMIPFWLVSLTGK